MLLRGRVYDLDKTEITLVFFELEILVMKSNISSDSELKNSRQEIEGLYQFVTSKSLKSEYLLLFCKRG